MPGPSRPTRPAQVLGRRRFLKVGGCALAATAICLLAPAVAADDPELAAIKALQPGEYVWHPERAPAGFVAIVVNLSDQRAFVYRNGVRIGVATVSSGADGHDTPTGVFTILGKDVDHHSSLYHEASMPYSERLTWDGVALHAGGLPGYPSSHGCVHLPLAFAKLLFSVTQVGTPVIIANSHTAPRDVLHPGLVIPAGLEAEAVASAKGAGEVQDVQAGETAISMVVSGADRSLTILKGAEVVAQGPIRLSDPQTPLGNVVYVLADVSGTPRWSAISFEGGQAIAGEAQQALARFTVDPALNSQLAQLVRPGATLFVTDLPAHAGTRSDGGFVILTHKVVS